MKHLKIISRLRIQSNTAKEGETLMKQLKRESKIKIQSNITREGKTLMKTTKKNVQSENAKEHQNRRQNAKMEREKAFEKVQGMSMVDPSMVDPRGLEHPCCSFHTMAASRVDENDDSRYNFHRQIHNMLHAE